MRVVRVDQCVVDVVRGRRGEDGAALLEDFLNVAGVVWEENVSRAEFEAEHGAVCSGPGVEGA